MLLVGSLGALGISTHHGLWTRSASKQPRLWWFFEMSLYCGLWGKWTVFCRSFWLTFKWHWLYDLWASAVSGIGKALLEAFYGFLWCFPRLFRAHSEVILETFAWKVVSFDGRIPPSFKVALWVHSTAFLNLRQTGLGSNFLEFHWELTLSGD